jgi:hypothetical protein
MYAVHDLSRENLWVCLCIGNKSVKTFPQQQIIGKVVFSVVPVVSKESRRLVLPRASCYIFNLNAGYFIEHLFFSSKFVNESFICLNWGSDGAGHEVCGLLDCNLVEFGKRHHYHRLDRYCKNFGQHLAGAQGSWQTALFRDNSITAVRPRHSWSG